MYKWAIVGCGRIFKKHVEALNHHKDKFIIQAVCDINENKLKEAEELTGSKGYKNIEDLLEEEKLDGISVCTPSGSHPIHTIIAANSGVNVISEKPFALSSLKAQEAIDVCNKNNVKLWIVKQNRLNPAIKLLKNAIDKKRFGNIYYIEINVFWNRNQEYFDMDNWHGTKSMDGGIIFNQASHYVDLMQYLGGGIKKVSALSKTLARKIEFEDTLSAIMEYKNGALGSFNVTVLTYRHNIEGSITILGEYGTVKIGGMALNKIDVWEFDKYDDDDREIEYVSTNPPNVYGFGHTEFYERVYDNLNNPNEKCIFDGNEMIDSIKIKEAIYKSVEKGETIYL